MAEACTIQRAFVVNGGGCKRDGWVVTDSELIDGTDFIKLSRLDTGFARFVCGNPKGMRDMKFLEQLRWLRTEASMKLGKFESEDSESLFDTSADETKATKKQKKHQMQTSKAMQDRGELPLVCTVTLPEVQVDDGVVIASKIAKVKTCLDPKALVAIEFRSDILDHIRALLLHSEAPSSRKRVKISGSSGVRWWPKSGYLACRKNDDDKLVYKTFRVADDADELTKAEVAQKAQRWVDGDEQDAEGDCDDDPCVDEIDDTKE